MWPPGHRLRKAAARSVEVSGCAGPRASRPADSQPCGAGGGARSHDRPCTPPGRWSPGSGTEASGIRFTCRGVLRRGGLGAPWPAVHNRVRSRSGLADWEPPFAAPRMQDGLGTTAAVCPQHQPRGLDHVRSHRQVSAVPPLLAVGRSTYVVLLPEPGMDVAESLRPCRLDGRVRRLPSPGHVFLYRHELMQHGLRRKGDKPRSGRLNATADEFAHPGRAEHRELAGQGKGTTRMDS